MGVYERYFSEIDHQFAELMTRLSGAESKDLKLAASLLSKHTRDGHVCLNLSSFAGTTLEDEARTLCPGLEEWILGLKESRVVGYPGHLRPMILDDHFRLYLGRYFDYEQRIAERILFLNGQGKNVDKGILKEGLKRLFPRFFDGIDWQTIAAVTPLIKGFSVITGGPGTGKTTTAARILALILEQNPQERIALCAPTGKAADKLLKSVSLVLPSLDCPEVVKSGFPGESFTIHRLLGSGYRTISFKYNAQNRLPYDVVLVDEASMVDLALMAKLFDALHDSARLILLGDRDQLVSVQAGYVLGDICDTGKSHAYSRRFTAQMHDLTGAPLKGDAGEGLQDAIVELRHNYRFGPESGIGKLSMAVNEGSDCLEILASEVHEDIRFTTLPAPGALKQKLRNAVIRGYRPCLVARDFQDCLNMFGTFKILCAIREGPYGVLAINALAERILAEAGLIRPDRPYYHGRPVMITVNDYGLRLFNGDVGIILRDPDDGRLYAWFEGAEERSRRIPVGRLPGHETVYAMTIHKSQGSEFEDVLMMLPNRDSRVLTRELVYTGITRARKHLDLWARDEVLQAAVSRRIERTSGLRDALWGASTIHPSPFHRS